MCVFMGFGGSFVVDFLFIVTPILGVCNCFMFCCTLLYVHSSIADFIGLPYFSGFPSRLKSHVLILHDFFSQPKFVPLPRDRVAMCSRPASKHQKKLRFVSKQASLYCIRSED